MMDRDGTEPVIVTEWRITGQPAQLYPGIEWTFPYYNHSWYSNRMYDITSRSEGPLVLTAEEAARRFMTHSPKSAWDTGPFLHSRTVTYEVWKEEK